MTPEDIRARAVEIAESLVGMSANRADPEARRAYMDLVAPGESERRREQLATVSGCGLVVAAVWRALGVRAPELEMPYLTGTAVSRLLRIAQRARAWVMFTTGSLPEPGDAVIVGGGSSGGVEHIYTVIAVSEDEGPTLDSVDGGQRDDDGAQQILARRRAWEGRSDRVEDASDPGATASGGRLIQGFIDVTRLPIDEERFAAWSREVEVESEGEASEI